MQTLNWKIMALSLGLFSSFSFILCVAWGSVVPPGLHGTRFLELTLPGFTWLSFKSFVLGLAETFVIGAYTGLAFSLIYNMFSRWQAAKQ